MTNSKALNLLGMARRANKISLGHDASVTSIKGKIACACILSCDSSERLQNEMNDLCSHENDNAVCLVSKYSMAELGMCMGAKTTAVLTVNDLGFANRLTQLLKEE